MLWLGSIRRFCALPFERQAAFIEAALLLAAAAIVTRTVPPKRYLRSPKTEQLESEHILELVRWAVDAAAGRAPVRGLCLTKAVAAKWMLNRRGVSSELQIGAAAGENGIQAHAWLTANGRTVVGADGTDQYSALSR